MTVILFLCVGLVIIGFICYKIGKHIRKKDRISKDGEKFNIVEVYTDNKLLLKLIGVKTAWDFKSNNNEKSNVVVFETSTGIDFVQVNAFNGMLGIQTELAYVSSVYPGFKATMQSLMDIKINGKILPCDLIHYKNNETGEEKDIYYEISSFYGK